MKNIQFVKYENKYKNGVLQCLKRNYPWMAQLTDEDLYDWIKPILEYRWLDMPQTSHPHGILMLKENSIVGFFGVIFSKRHNNMGEEYICQSYTTWCIDKKYRPYIIEAIKYLTQNNDIYWDLTPCSVMYDSFTNFFKFEKIETKFIRFYPIPYMKKKNLEINIINSPNEIDNSIIKNELQDHLCYDIKCAKFSSKAETGYIFYKIMKYNGLWLKIMKIENKTLFSQNAHEILWHLQHKECFFSIKDIQESVCKIIKNQCDKIWMYTECSRLFVDMKMLNHPLYDLRDSKLISLNKSNIKNPNLDFLYTEIAMLDYDKCSFYSNLIHFCKSKNFLTLIEPSKNVSLSFVP